MRGQCADGAAVYQCAHDGFGRDAPVARIGAAEDLIHEKQYR